MNTKKLNVCFLYNCQIRIACAARKERERDIFKYQEGNLSGTEHVRSAARAHTSRHLTDTSSNHRLESAGLNALEELLFKMLGMGRLREDSNAYLVYKRNWIR